MRRLLFGILIATGALLVALQPATLLAQCPGTSGSATINSTAWTANCVIAATALDCVDSTGSTYECFEIIGSDDGSGIYSTVALFFGQPPTQGQSYDLGGTSSNGALVVGETGICVTADAPYTGQVTVTVYDPGAGSIECTFHFEARSIFFGPDVSVTDGHFIGTLVPVQPSTWTDLKTIYR